RARPVVSPMCELRAEGESSRARYLTVNFTVLALPPRGVAVKTYTAAFSGWPEIRALKRSLVVPALSDFDVELPTLTARVHDFPSRLWPRATHVLPWRTPRSCRVTVNVTVAARLSETVSVAPPATRFFGGVASVDPERAGLNLDGDSDNDRITGT